MAVTYTNAVKIDRMDAVIAAIGSAGKLEIGTTGMATTLAVFTLSSPAAPGAAGAGVITFTMPKSDTNADDTGTAAAARIVTSADLDIITGLTVGVTAEDIVLDSASITAGQTVTISSATITHA